MLTATGSRPDARLKATGYLAVATVLVIVALVGFPASSGASGNFVHGADTVMMATTPRRALAASIATVRANGHVIGYRSFGRGSAVVLVQGLGGTIDNWDPQFVDRLARGHRVVAFDNRGIGRSTGTVNGLSMRQMADDVAGLIRALHLGRPTVLGFSMGGVIAQQFALDHPNSASRLVLVSTSPGGPKSVSSVAAARTVPPFDWSKNLDLFFSTPRAGAAYMRSITRRPNLEQVPLAAEIAHGVALTQSLVSSDIWDRLPSLRVPTLVTVGTQDPLVPPTNSALIAARIPEAQLVRFPGLRHGFFMERPDEFVPVLNRFVASPSHPHTTPASVPTNR
jgi:pimeloyl-ACP methyl ester carboxylesterase